MSLPELNELVHVMSFSHLLFVNSSASQFTKFFRLKNTHDEDYSCNYTNIDQL